LKFATLKKQKNSGIGKSVRVKNVMSITSKISTRGTISQLAKSNRNLLPGRETEFTSSFAPLYDQLNISMNPPSITVIKELFTNPTKIAFAKNRDPLAQLWRILLKANVFGSSQSSQTRS
jgi:hypothetical protein